MMAKKDRFPRGYSADFAPRYESEGSGSPDHIDSTEDSAPMRKLIDLNSASRDGFAVPMQIIHLSKLSSFEKRSLALRLTKELEQIKLVQEKLDLQAKEAGNAVTVSSSDITKSIAQQKGLKGLQLDNTKKASGMDSGPGKKGRGWTRGVTGRFMSANHKRFELANHKRFESANQDVLVNANAGLLKQCESLLKKLMSQQYAWVFNTPVDVVKLNIPDYFDVIKNPMDLGTIKKKLTSGEYSSPLDFLADVRLTFTNAKTYNPAGSDVHLMADTMSQFFEIRWKAIDKKLVADTPRSVPKRSDSLGETEKVNLIAHLKKRKLSPTVHEVIRQPSKPQMTDEEKLKLSGELENFGGDLPDSILDILRPQSLSGGDGGEDEIEIDFNDLTDETLFTLRKILDDLQEKQKDLNKSEACEIELPNVSGLSNSSLQVDKGDDPLDEDVDIGDYEGPVTSYPAVVIDKEVEGRAEERTEAGPRSERGSECSGGSSDVKQVQVFQNDVGQMADSNNKAEADELVDLHASMRGLDQLELSSQPKPYSSDSDGQLDGESEQAERQVSPDKLYRAALLKNRFADTILKAREKTLQDDKMDPEKLRREREELEMHKRREKERLQAEAKAAEDAKRRVEAEAAAEAKRMRELEREAAREALLKMEKTVELENSRFLEDLEMLRGVGSEQLPSSVGETSPDNSQDGLGIFKFGGSNPLEQLGLYMKNDEDDEEGEPPRVPNVVMDDVEEGEID